MNVGTLLGIWAHPDDEAYLSAGLMAEARATGNRVVVVTATVGEHGTGDPTGCPPERLAVVRRRELQASLAAVGVHEHRFLGFEDGACAQEDGTELLARIIAAVDPDTIVTFGPDGMTGHPDHQAVSAWTGAAHQLTGSRARLWHATLSPAFHEEWGALNERVGLWGDATPPCTEPEELAHSVTLTGARLEQKLAALTAHRSQTAGLIAEVGTETFRRWWRTEWFVDAARVTAHS
jgi:LmbE family N-acetylglucosaminyl deacetylase